MRLWAEFVLVIKVQHLAKEFSDLRQTTETVAEFTVMFCERVLLITQYVTDEEMKNARYYDMLNDEIQEFVSMFSCRTLEDTITRAWKRDIDLETMSMRKSVQAQVSEGSIKKPKGFDSQSKGQ